jgi:hypothetical protein
MLLGKRAPVPIAELLVGRFECAQHRPGHGELVLAEEAADDFDQLPAVLPAARRRRFYEDVEFVIFFVGSLTGKGTEKGPLFARLPLYYGEAADPGSYGHRTSRALVGA